MPYLITTTTPSGWRSPPPFGKFDGVTRTARHAVATLDEARAAAHEIIWERYEDSAPPLDDVTDAAVSLPESGGSVGPLPDGTVIEVEAVCWNWIIGTADDLGIDTDEVHDDAPSGQGDLAILAAFNAAQEA